MGTGSDDDARGDFRRTAANDNPGPGSPGRSPRQAGAGRGPEARIEAAAMRLARLIGRQIAREHFGAACAANDNAPEDGAGER